MLAPPSLNDTVTALLMARFYELHIGEQLSPATALGRAKAWLRQAANADLVAYTENAAFNVRLAPRLAAEITQELSTEALRRSRHSTAVEWLPPERTQRSGTRALDATAASVRPFAHPYFWAGFVHTGS